MLLGNNLACEFCNPVLQAVLGLLHALQDSIIQTRAIWGLKRRFTYEIAFPLNILSFKKALPITGTFYNQVPRQTIASKN